MPAPRLRDLNASVVPSLGYVDMPGNGTRKTVTGPARLPHSTLAMVTGCLLGGAAGEALGRRVAEGLPAEFGPIRGSGGGDDAAEDGRVGAIGWRTQLTMMTAEGLLRADNRMRARGFAAVDEVV